MASTRVLLWASALVAAATGAIGASLAGRPPSDLATVTDLVPGAPKSVAPPAGGAAAPSSGPPVDTAGFALQPLFDVLDCERQGIVRAGEVDEHIAQLLAVYDRDGSRTISRAEYLKGAKGALGERRAALYASIDQNRDGVGSAKEFARHVVAMIARADSNRDGELTRQELAQN